VTALPPAENADPAALIEENRRLRAELARARRAADGEEAQRLAVRELSHRIKNVLAVVQSLAKQSLRDGATLAEARESLDRRLAAMGRGVDLLLKRDWSATGMAALARAALSHRDSYPGRFAIDGPAVEIGAAAALTLAMALHELETNAIKHGALTAADGTVSLSWSEAAGRLRLEWRETGCTLAGPPARTGFGMRLIRDVPARRFGATAMLDWRTDGLCWTLTADLARLRD
jgi:two-component sensor histidine kinase